MSRGFCGQCGEPYDDEYAPHKCPVYYVVQEKTKHGPFTSYDDAVWWKTHVLMDVKAKVKIQ